MAYWCNTATYGVIGLGPRSAAVKCLQRLRRSAAEEGCGKDKVVHLVLWWSKVAQLGHASRVAALEHCGARSVNEILFMRSLACSCVTASAERAQ